MKSSYDNILGPRALNRIFWHDNFCDSMAALIIEPFQKLSQSDQDELIEEGAKLLQFAAPEAK